MHKVRLISFLDSIHIIINSYAALRLLHEGYESLNSHDYFGIVSLDFSKAFDTVYHRIVLYKLHNYGIVGIAHNLFKSYLSIYL